MSARIDRRSQEQQERFSRCKAVEENEIIAIRGACDDLLEVSSMDGNRMRQVHTCNLVLRQAYVVWVRFNGIDYCREAAVSRAAGFIS